MTISYTRNRLYLLRVSGSSMHPSYKDGELLLILKTKIYEVGDPVVASVKIRGFGGPITVLKRIASKEAVAGTGSQSARTMYRLIGDNGKASLDSRSTAFGMVAEEDLKGKVLFRLDE
ncbi:S24/S26 family peptidase [Fusibacter sp. JL216-2]|uniref:S24/S26 family peptidase n=1 Tax=Fusibacter sp. JL216-2 TaxID=3071453 RepID=UPI003D34D65E